MRTHPLLHTVSKTLISIATLLLPVHLGAEQYAIERIHLHVQKSILMTGEGLSYKLYCLNANTKKLSQISNVAYVELIDEKGASVYQQSTILQNGMGQGEFLIPLNLPSGNYSINAYTSWMNSISPKLTGLVQIFVFNAHKMESMKANPNSGQAEIIQPKQAAIGKLSLNTYWGESRESLNLEISPPKGESEEEYLLKLFSRKGIEKTIKFNLKEGKRNINLKTANLLPGTYGISISNQDDSIIACQSFHLEDPTQTIKHSKFKLNSVPRKKVRIPFQLSNFTEDQDTLYLSASIRLKGPLNLSSTTSMVDFWNVSLDFEAQKLCSLPQKNPNSNWISQQGIAPLWLSSPTEYSVKSDRYPEKEAYILEGKLTVEGSKQGIPNTLVYLSKLGAYADISPCLTNANGLFYFHLPLENGIHDFALQAPEHLDQKLTYRLKEKFRGSGIPPSKPKNSILQGNRLEYLKLMWENQKVRNIYQRKQYITQKDTSKRAGRRNFFDTPYFHLNIDQYIKMDSIEEYFHELIPNAIVKYKDKKYSFRIVTPEISTILKGEPLVLFDGLILDDCNEVLNKRVQDIGQIEVVPFEYYYKAASFKGIIHIISQNQKGELTKLPLNTERYYLPLFTRNIKRNPFNSYGDKANLPDFRTDLLWEPNIEIYQGKNFNLEFYTSDIKGEYELVIEGISAKGKPVSYIRTIIVE